MGEAGRSGTVSTGAAPLAGEQIAIVAAVYRRFAHAAGESLTALARTPFQFRLAAVQRLPCRDLRERAARPAALASIALDPLPGAALCMVDRPLAFLLIDRLLGGRGAAALPDRGWCAPPSPWRPERKPGNSTWR